ncbi:MAG: zinc ribbon domain-containing protein [Caldilineaceae bacterium]
MLWISILLALLISLAALAFALWPLLSKEPPLVQVENEQLTDLLARKDSTLRAIKDLEFDHQVGKVSADDFQRFNQRLSRQAIGLIQQIEKITPDSATLDQQLEAEIVKARRTTAASVAPTTVPVPPVMAAPVVSGKAHFCTQCGAKLETSYKFCANCGAPVPQVVSEVG